MDLRSSNSDFNGFKIYPIGNASLEIVNGILRVKDISNTGLDGVIIETSNKENCEVYFDKMPQLAQRDAVFKTSTLVRNELRQIVPSIESFKWFDRIKRQIMIGYNFGLLPKDFTVFGNLQGKNVYSLKKDDILIISNKINASPEMALPIIVGIAGAVAAIAGVAVAVWSELHTKTTTSKTTIYDADGKVIGYEETITEDPMPFEIKFANNRYTIDEFGLTLKNVFPTEMAGNHSVKYSIAAKQITASNIDYFDIINIK